MFDVCVLSKNQALNIPTWSIEASRKKRIRSQKQIICKRAWTIQTTATAEATTWEILLKNSEMIFKRRSNQDWIERKTEKEESRKRIVCESLYSQRKKIQARWLWNQNHVSFRWSESVQRWIRKNDTWYRSETKRNWWYNRISRIEKETRQTDSRIRTFYFIQHKHKWIIVDYATKSFQTDSIDDQHFDVQDVARYKMNSFQKWLQKRADLMKKMNIWEVVSSIQKQNIRNWIEDIKRWKKDMTYCDENTVQIWKKLTILK